jgi:hypothetical protein
LKFYKHFSYFALIRFERKAVVVCPEKNGYQLEWIDDGWGPQDTKGCLSSRIWYNEELYLFLVLFLLQYILLQILLLIIIQKNVSR